MKKKIKILHIVSSFNKNQGGPPEAIKNIAYSLRSNKKIQSSLITSSNIILKLKYFTKVSNNKLFLKKFYLPSIQMLINMWDQIKKNDVIHVHNYWNVVVFFGLYFSILLKKKIILSPHGSFDNFNLKKSYLKKYVFFHIFGIYQLKKIAGIHYLTKNEENNSFLKNKTNTKKLILSNFSKKIFVTSKPKEIINKNLNFCFIGRLDEVKNIKFQIKLINYLHKIRIRAYLHIIGPDFGEKKKLIKAIKNYSLENYVKIYNPIYSKKKYSWLKYSDFVFLTSHYECNSILALETLACGGRLITNRHSNLYFLKNYRAALFISNDLALSAKKIIQLFKNKQNLKKLRTNALLFTKKFNDIYFSKKISNFYNIILSN